MSARRVAVNDRGAVVGQDHWRAKFTDREVELIRLLTGERDALVQALQAAGVGAAEINSRLCAAGLSYAAIAGKFEISKTHVRNIANDRVRAQTAYRTKVRTYSKDAANA